MQNRNIRIGFNARMFPNNWRPALQEIEFAQHVGFQAIQFRGPETGLDEELLGSSIADVSQTLKHHNITSVMEMLILVNHNGKTTAGRSPLDILQANLPAITELGCEHVHWHLAPTAFDEITDHARFEASLIPMFAQAVEVARENNFSF